MKQEPRISLYCDSCHETTEFEMTSLANGDWDDGNLRTVSESDGWVWNGDDSHDCPDCERCSGCDNLVDECACCPDCDEPPHYCACNDDDECVNCGYHPDECICCPECGDHPDYCKHPSS